MFDYKPSADLLRDRVILVTGAGTGIGRAVALAAAAHGATLVLLGRSQARLEETYDAIETAGHPQPALVPLNLETATVKDYEELAATLDREFGRLDGLLHNAGILGRLAPIDHYDPETWLKVCQVNLNAPFLLTRACLPLLRSPEQASVLFTSAEVGRQGRAYWGAYAASLAGVEGLVEVLADELENTAIRVNSIDPGPVRTGLREEAYPAEDPTPLALPESVVGPYLYLLGPDGHGVHGRKLHAQRQSGVPGSG